MWYAEERIFASTVLKLQHFHMSEQNAAHDKFLSPRQDWLNVGSGRSRPKVQRHPTQATASCVVATFFGEQIFFLDANNFFGMSKVRILFQPSLHEISSVLPPNASRRLFPFDTNIVAPVRPKVFAHCRVLQAGLSHELPKAVFKYSPKNSLF